MIVSRGHGVHEGDIQQGEEMVPDGNGLYRVMELTMDMDPTVGMGLGEGTHLTETEGLVVGTSPMVQQTLTDRSGDVNRLMR